MTKTTAFVAGVLVGVFIGIWLLTKGQAKVYGHGHLEWLEYQNEVMEDHE